LSHAVFDRLTAAEMWDWHVKPAIEKGRKMKKMLDGEPERELTPEEICSSLEMMGVLKPRAKG
jgi:hypothetical protein